MEVNSISSPAVTAQKTSQSATKPTEMDGVNRQRTDSSVASPVPKAQEETLKKVTEQIEVLNRQLSQVGQSLAFSVDEGTQSSVVKVIDKVTDEVIRQFPTEGSLKIMNNIQNYLNLVQQNGLTTKEGLTGVLFNEII